MRTRPSALVLLSRCISIGALAAIVGWVGFRIAGTPQDAHAEIFRNLSSTLLQQAGLPPGDGWRVSRVNGVVLPYRVEQHQKSLESLFDELERSSAGAPNAVADADAPGSGFRQQWRGWGVLGMPVAPAATALPAGAGAGPQAGSGILTTVAFEDRTATSTTALTLWIDANFDASALLSGAGRIASPDADQLPRYPGLERQYLIELGSEAESIVLTYAGRGNPSHVAAYYATEMTGRGWRELPVEQPRGVRFFQRGKRDCAVAVVPGDVPGTVQVTVTVHGASAPVTRGAAG